MHNNTEIQTARIGVPVNGMILVQTLENGMSLSRENAKTVRPRACIAVNVTNLMMMKAHTVNVIPPAFPRTL